MPPHVVMDEGTPRASHWLMAQGRLLELQGAHEELYLLKDVWLPEDHGVGTQTPWWSFNLHNSPHDVGNSGNGGIGWGFGNGVSCLAFCLDPAFERCRGVLAAQVIKPQARVLAAAREIGCVEVDLQVLRGEREPELKLFAA